MNAILKGSLNEDTPAFSSVDCVGQCMMDMERSIAFDKAIRETVKPTDQVLDAGTGSGLLALMAARCGVRQVTAIEIDPYVAHLAAENVQHNSLADIVHVVVADATSYEFPPGTHFDVVLMELLTTGLIDETQIQAVNNLHQQRVVDESTRFIPRRQHTSISLARMNYDVLGIQMKMVRHLWNDFYNPEAIERLSADTHLHSVDFASLCPDTFEGEVVLTAKQSGLVNAVAFESTTDLTDTINLKNTLAMNAPVVYPVREVRVSAGQTLRLRVSYRFGRGFNSLSVRFVDQ